MVLFYCLESNFYFQSTLARILYYILVLLWLIFPFPDITSIGHLLSADSPDKWHVNGPVRTSFF